MYDDLIDVQEAKDSEGLLTGNEQKQLGRLRDAYADLWKQNRPLSVRAKRHCRCGFSAASRLELELHRDFGNVSTDDEYHIACCLCNLQNVRSPLVMAGHIDRVHLRQARLSAFPSLGSCPFCPYEQRTVTKVKLLRHVNHCQLNFHLDKNLAPTAADADIPLFEIVQPPGSSAAPSTSPAPEVAPKTPVPTTAESLPSGDSAISGVASSGAGCTTVSVGIPVMTPRELTTLLTSAMPKMSLAKLARIAPLPEGLGFEICELCGAFLASRESMAFHMERTHRLVLPEVCLRAEKPLVSCQRCSERFWTHTGLAVHEAQIHEAGTESGGTPTTVCPLCKRTRLTDVVEHLSRQHRITLVDMFAQRYCSICQLGLGSARSFEHHMMSRHSDLFPDRAALRAAIVMVDRASRGRVGMVARGRQPAVLSGATIRASADPLRTWNWSCAVCACAFSSDSDLQDHMRRSHSRMCPHCGRKCTSPEYLSYHILKAHSEEYVSCDVCQEEVTVSEMAGHLEDVHMWPCSVNVSDCGQDERVVQKRRRQLSGSCSSVDSDQGSDPLEEPDAKRLKVD